MTEREKAELILFLLGVLFVVFPALVVNFFRLGAFFNLAFKEAKQPITPNSLLLGRLFGSVFILLALSFHFRWL